MLLTKLEVSGSRTGTLIIHWHSRQTSGPSLESGDTEVLNHRVLTRLYGHFGQFSPMRSHLPPLRIVYTLFVLANVTLFALSKKSVSYLPQEETPN